MYEISVKTQFSAGHHLAGYRGSCAKPHGHNWEVQVFIRGEELDKLGMLVDFREVKKAVQEILAELDHTDLNTLPAFAKRNPTSENIARHLYGKLSGKFNAAGRAVSRVMVSETPQTSVSYSE